MKTLLDTNEHILKEGMANLLRRRKSFGGKLYLTHRRLVFEPHVATPKCGMEVIPIDEISTVEKRWTKVLRFIPLVPNSLAVTTSEGSEYWFVLFGRDDWESAISGARVSG
jgi:hypothetical protein